MPSDGGGDPLKWKICMRIKKDTISFAHQTGSMHLTVTTSGPYIDPTAKTRITQACLSSGEGGQCDISLALSSLPDGF